MRCDGRDQARDGGSRRSSHDEWRAQRHCEQWWWVAQHAGGRIRTRDPSNEPPAPATAPKTGHAHPPQPPHDLSKIGHAQFCHFRPSSSSNHMPCVRDLPLFIRKGKLSRRHAECTSDPLREGSLSARRALHAAGAYNACAYYRLAHAFLLRQSAREPASVRRASTRVYRTYIHTRSIRVRVSS